MNTLKITQGGTYTGHYGSLDSTIPAISVATSEPVILTDCIIEHAGEGVHVSGGATLFIKNTSFTGLKPTGNNQSGRAVNIYKPISFTFENNTVEKTGGVLIDHGTGCSINIRHNRFKNVDGRKVDGSNGAWRQAVQFNTVRAMTYSEVAWNEVFNIYGDSRVEDVINIYNTSGTSSSPLRIHDNYIDGAFPSKGETHFGGSGITIDGSPAEGSTLDTVSANILIYDNQLIRTCNAAINFATGNNCHAFDNRIVSAGYLPDGTQPKSMFWAGVCIWNGSKLSTSVFANNTIENNIIGYVNNGNENYPYIGRHDENNQHDSSGTRIVNVMSPGKNTYMPDGSVTKQAEDDEFLIWQQKQTVPSTMDVTITKGSKTTGVITPLDINGQPTSYKGSLSVISKDMNVFTISDVEEASFVITGISGGVAGGTAQIVSSDGTTITKDFNVEVKTPQAVDMKIVFNQ